MWGAPETSHELKTFKETPQMAEKLLFSMFPLILILNFYLVLDPFLIFLGPKGVFWGLRYSSKTVMRSIAIAEQLYSPFYSYF